MKFVKGLTEGGMTCYTCGNTRVAVQHSSKTNSDHVALLQKRGSKPPFFYVVAQLSSKPAYLDYAKRGFDGEEEWLEMALSNLLMKLVDNNHAGVIMAAELGDNKTVSIK